MNPQRRVQNLPLRKLQMIGFAALLAYMSQCEKVNHAYTVSLSFVFLNVPNTLEVKNMVSFYSFFFFACILITNLSGGKKQYKIWLIASSTVDPGCSRASLRDYYLFMTLSTLIGRQHRAKTKSTTISMRAVFLRALTCLISAQTVLVLTLTDSPGPGVGAEHLIDFHFLCSTDVLPGIC